MGRGQPLRSLGSEFDALGTHWEPGLHRYASRVDAVGPFGRGNEFERFQLDGCSRRGSRAADSACGAGSTSMTARSRITGSGLLRSAVLLLVSAGLVFGQGSSKISKDFKKGSWAEVEVIVQFTPAAEKWIESTL